MGLLDIRKIEHVSQTNSQNCVAASLSMVTGISIEGVEKQLHNLGYREPYQNEAWVSFLVQNNIYPELTSTLLIGPLQDDSIYLCSCVSKSGSGAHMIVLICYKGAIWIKDPSDDLENKQYYTMQNFQDGTIPIFEYVKLTDCSIPNEVEKKCKNCDWRSPSGHCQNDTKIFENNDRERTNDQLVYAYDEGGYFLVGDNFGCVHFARGLQND